MNPLHQFVVKLIYPLSINGWDVSLTNSSLFMVLSVMCGLVFIFACTYKKRIVPTLGQNLIEKLYLFVQKTAETTIGKDYEAYMPFMFSIFVFIFMGNAFGLLPYSFTFTSQLIPIAAFALFGTFIAMMCGLYHMGLSWFRIFLPKGIPVMIAPIIIPIEIISFISKPFSLTVRLIMNMIVGHVLLKILATFIVELGIFGIFPMFFTCVLLLFEFGIAFLQAYVYTVLTGIYLGESIDKTH